VDIEPGQIVKSTFVEALKKEAAIIAEYFWLQNQNIGNGSVGNLHIGLQGNMAPSKI
jgi:hypothetical protein